MILMGNLVLGNKLICMYMLWRLLCLTCHIQHVTILQYTQVSNHKETCDDVNDEAVSLLGSSIDIHDQHIHINVILYKRYSTMKLYQCLAIYSLDTSVFMVNMMFYSMCGPQLWCVYWVVMFIIITLLGDNKPLLIFPKTIFSHVALVGWYNKLAVSSCKFPYQLVG